MKTSYGFFHFLLKKSRETRMAFSGAFGGSFSCALAFLALFYCAFSVFQVVCCSEWLVFS
jgi:hypothetical protein